MVAKKQQEKEEAKDVVVQESEPVEEYTDPEKVPIHVALARVMADVKAVGKSGYNSHQNYNFRGIDGVMNGVGPALRTHGVLPDITMELLKHDHVKAGNRVQTQVLLKLELNFTGPCGDQMKHPIVVFGEATDYQDKAVAKAHSVAYRTALLQALCLPTDEPDPDEYSDPVHMPQQGPDPAQVEADILAEVQTLNDVEALRKLWSAANAHGALTDAVKDAITARVKEVESSGDASSESGGGGAPDSGPVESDS